MMDKKKRLQELHSRMKVAENALCHLLHIAKAKEDQSISAERVFCTIASCRGAIYHSKSSLRRHLEETTWHAEDRKRRKYKCEECDRTFDLRHYLQHLNTGAHPIVSYSVPIIIAKADTILGS